MKLEKLSNHFVTKNIRQSFLQWLKLDKAYTQGKGDWLWYESDEGLKRVLDLTGSYGINLLGHKHPELTEFAIELLKDQRPIFAKVSKNEHLTHFQKQFESLLKKEVNHKDWNFFHSNTGTESVEVALKIAWLNYQSRKAAFEQQLHQTCFQIKSNYEKLAPQFAEELQIYSQSEALAYYHQWLKKLQNPPLLLAVKNSFHGKTAGALSAMGNECFRQSFPSSYKTH